MAVICVFGMTQSGKSRLVEAKIIPLYKRVLVYDVVNCFRSLPIRISMDAKFGLENTALDKAYELALKNPDFFRIGLVPGEKTDDRKAFDKVVTTALFMGKAFASSEDPMLLVADESGVVCSSRFQSAKLQKLVTRGRHWHVNSLFIAQRPQMIHGDIKGNVSEVNCFRLPTAPEIPFLVEYFGKEIANQIKNLPKYHYVTGKDTGEVTFTDESGKIYRRIGG